MHVGAREVERASGKEWGGALLEREWEESGLCMM